jgi:hypothetical protein
MTLTIACIALSQMLIYETNAISAKVYKNLQFGMIIEYPSDWTVDTSIFNPNAQLPTVVFRPPSETDTDYNPFISLSVSRGNTSSPQAFIQDNIDFIQKLGGIIQQEGPAVFNGGDAYSFTFVFENTPAAGTVKGVYLAVKSDLDTIYLFHLDKVPPEAYDHYISILKLMVEKAQLHGAPQPK